MSNGISKSKHDSAEQELKRMLENREADPPEIQDILWSPITELVGQAEKLLEKRRNPK